MYYHALLAPSVGAELVVSLSVWTGGEDSTWWFPH